MKPAIKTYLYAVPAGLDFGREVRSMLDEIPAWRREKVLSYRFDIDRFLCAKAFLLLKDALSADFGITDVRFGYGEFGKPYLESCPEVFFNLSHCKKAVACIVGNVPVGIDVEEMQYDEGLAGSVLSRAEFASVLSSPDREEAFTKAWTVRESYLKMLGRGIPDDMSCVDCSGAEFETCVFRESGFVLTTAVKSV